MTGVTLHSRVGSHHGLHVKRGPLLGEEVARARSAIHVAERVEGRPGRVRDHQLRFGVERLEIDVPANLADVRKIL